MDNLTPEQIAKIKRRGSVLIKNVVETEKAAAWKEELAQYVKENPVEGESIFRSRAQRCSTSETGIPADDKQFFML